MDHRKGHRLSAELGFIKNIAERILCHSIEFPIAACLRIIVIILADLIKGRLNFPGAILPDQILLADILKNPGNILRLKVFIDIPVIEDVFVQYIPLRKEAEDVAIVKQRQVIHDEVAGFAAVVRIVDRGLLLHDLHANQLLQYIHQCRTT